MTDVETIMYNGKQYPLEIPYSTEEIRVGTWKIGKPLYRKIIETEVPEVTTDGTYAPNKNVTIGSNIDMSFIDNAFVINNEGECQNLLYINNAGRMIKAFTNKDILAITSNAVVFSEKPLVAIILYTKN